MPVNEKQSGLRKRIDELKWCAAALAADITANEAINSTTLEKATKSTADLFLLIKDYINESPQEVPGLNKYLSDVAEIAIDINAIASGEVKKFAKPNDYMKALISAFEAFSTRVATEQTRERLRRAASFVPVVDGVVAACGGIPFYFEHAAPPEKIAMILCATLLVTALALTIAVYASPAVAAVPLLWPAITACVLLARVLYDQASFNAKKRYEEKPKIEEQAAKINTITEDINAYKKMQFPEQVELGRKDMERAVKDLRKFADETERTIKPKRKLLNIYGPGERKRKKNENLFRIQKTKTKPKNE